MIYENRIVLFGPNIKRLKGKLSSIYRFRIGNYRLFYTIDSEKKLVFMLENTPTVNLQILFYCFKRLDSVNTRNDSYLYLMTTL